MRVLHVTTNYPTPEYPIFGIFVKEQVESLKKLGVECDVFYCNGKNRGFRQYIKYLPKLWVQVKSNKYDIIHCHHALSALLLCMTGWPLFRKCILSYQNDPDREWGRWIFRYLYLFFKVFIVKNNSSYLRFRKVLCLPNGCNADFFYPMDKALCRIKLGWCVDKIYIMYMDSNKRIRLQKRKDRYDETLNILDYKYGYKNIVSVELRNTPREIIPIYINACDLHLLSSDFEGSPNSVKECMCCNTPVVSTDVGNVREMIGDIVGSFVVNEFSAEELAKAVDCVLKSKIQFNGRDTFLLKGYDMDTVAKKLLYIYSK